MRKLSAQFCCLPSLRFWKSQLEYLVLALKSKSFKAFAGREMPGSVRVDQVSQAHRVISAIPRKHAEAELWFDGLQKSPSPFFFPALTSLFRGLLLYSVCLVVHPQHLCAGSTYNPQWQRGAHCTVRAHDKQVVLPWPDHRTQLVPGIAEVIATKQWLFGKRKQQTTPK